MDNMDLELQNSSSNTALCIAATAGHVAVAKIMVTKHEALLDIAGSQGMMPLHMAALSGKHDMVKYLYEKSERMTRGTWTDVSRCSVLLACVEVELFDIAIQIVNDRPELAVSGGNSLLQVLARKPRAFVRKSTFIQKLFYPRIEPQALLSESQVKRLGEESQALQLLKIIWEITEKLPTTEIDGMLRGPADEDKNLATMPKYSSRLLFVAAENGNSEFIIELIRKYPERVLELNENKQSIFHVAVLHRRANVYTLLYEISSIMESIINLEDINGNNMLHLVGIIEETTIYKGFEDMSQVYAQMQEELLWFKKVFAILPPSHRVKKNKDGLSPHELFIKNHKDLVSKGQEWMKKTFSELLLLAALLITISFAAAMSFASGSNPDTTPHTRKYKGIYNAFMIYNGISFLCASYSIISILSIISSRYVSQDFLESLPNNLKGVILAVWGSMFFMVSAFSMIICLLYHHDYPWVTPVLTALIIMALLIFYYVLFTSRLSIIFVSTSFENVSLRNKEIMYQET